MSESEPHKLCGVSSLGRTHTCQLSNRHPGGHYNEFIGSWNNSGAVAPTTGGGLVKAAIEEERRDVETAMLAAEAGNAGHWPTVAAVLHDEVLRLRNSGVAVAPTTSGELFDVAERMGAAVVELKAGIEKLRSDHSDALAKATTASRDSAKKRLDLDVAQDEIKRLRDEVARLSADPTRPDGTFANYQNLTDETAEYPGANVWGHMNLSMPYLALGLTGESGEVAGIIKKVLRSRESFVDNSRDAHLREELGDALWYLARICQEKRWQLADIANENLDKLAGRKARGELKDRADYFPGLSEQAERVVLVPDRRTCTSTNAGRRCCLGAGHSAIHRASGLPPAGWSD